MKKKQYLGIFILVLIIVLIIEYIERLLDIQYPDNGLKEHKESTLTLILLAGLAAPVIEECIFRYPLKKGKLIYPSLIISSIIIFALSSSYYVSLSYLTLNIITFSIYYFKSNKEIPLYLTFLYSILFIIIHFENYKLQELFTLSYGAILLLFSSQIILSIALAYIRIKCIRFFPVILFHSMYNLVIITLSTIDI